jgi:hypothetical protein
LDVLKESVDPKESEGQRDQVDRKVLVDQEDSEGLAVEDSAVVEEGKRG